ncbi:MULTISPECIES: UDP-2,3-diacylglucosamine diphosphatase [Rhodomicrobium]|uniref:UDP-2,3-diacylglucosamine diphosphatase n=1 Tax=Rhodomicrobium TaxID=1068 RepID=UPI0014820163|nr:MULTISPECIES: UDP-2,3-diacylglucosamine diphosphatase [Rhodomicrobium]
MQQPSEQDGLSKHYRTLFISDVHLGTKACQASHLLEFLRRYEADTYYLVGDIVDFWRIRRTPHWPQSHNDVVQKLLRKVRKGARFIYIPGNHDEALRAYCGQQFGGIEFKQNDIHVTADGRRFLVMHGDEFDVVIQYVKWLAFLGDWAYVAALGINTSFNKVRRRFGFSYWSLSGYLKHKVKKAVNYIGDFETALSGEAKRHAAEGVICGHIHFAAIREIAGTTYINCGDWVESATAVGETHDGKFELIRWLDVLEAEQADAMALSQTAAAA